MNERNRPASRQPPGRGRTRQIRRAISDSRETAIPGPPLIEVMPAATDPALDRWLDPHLVAVEPACATRPRLFLFLCGSFGIPARQQRITRVAAALGYHAVNLNYPNAWTVGGLCRDAADADCHGRLRLDILDGGDRSGLVRLGAAQSIYGRLERLLRHLSAQRPQEGWGQFLGDDGVDWSSVVVAGHSQGGGQAAMLGKQQRLARVVLFAAPADHCRAAGVPAAWLAEPAATPAERWLGFVHRDDPGMVQIRRAWELLGMADIAAPVNVDRSAPPYRHSHCLYTDTAEIRPDRAHGCIVQDRLTPLRDDGRPLFEPVWRYLLGEHD